MFENCVVMADCITTSENSDNQGDENYFVVMEVENETVPESEVKIHEFRFPLEFLRIIMIPYFPYSGECCESR